MSITISLTLLALVWGIWIYNRLVRDRVRVETAWSDIGVQLKRRHDLIPKLVTAVKQYAEYESATLEATTALRQQQDVMSNVANAESIGNEERQLSTQLKQLIAIAEDYPTLKADASFLDLQKNLTNVEHHLQHARRFYNGAVRNLNIRVDSFPDNFIANAFNFSKASFFEFDPVTESVAE